MSYVNRVKMKQAADRVREKRRKVKRLIASASGQADQERRKAEKIMASIPPPKYEAARTGV